MSEIACPVKHRPRGIMASVESHLKPALLAGRRVAMAAWRIALNNPPPRELVLFTCTGFAIGATVALAFRNGMRRLPSLPPSPPVKKVAFHTLFTDSNDHEHKHEQEHLCCGLEHGEAPKHAEASGALAHDHSHAMHGDEHGHEHGDSCFSGKERHDHDHANPPSHATHEHSHAMHEPPPLPPVPPGPPQLGAILSLAKETGKTRKDCKAALIAHGNDYEAARATLMPPPPDAPAPPPSGSAVAGVYQPASKFDGGRPPEHVRVERATPRRDDALPLPCGDLHSARGMRGS